MRVPKHLRQFSLRTLLLVTLASCIVAYFDPLGWRPPKPVPIKIVNAGETAEVDLIEVNHLYDASGRLVFDQLLFWSFHRDGKLHLREWRLLKSPSMAPQRSYKKWICTWIEHGIERRVEAPAYRETKSTVDHELLDRESVLKQDRILLWSSATIRPPGGDDSRAVSNER